MKYKRITAGFTFDLCKQYDLIVPENWSDKKVMKKFTKENPELKIYNISAIDKAEAVNATNYEG